MLIEKAAAKLHGSYESLNGGTFAEAFGMLTGMPIHIIRLSRYKPPKVPDGKVLTPEESRSFERVMSKWRAKGYDYDELYAQLFSYKASGFLIGCSTFFHTEKEINEARATGIQVPHAYCLLELANVGGEDLVKMRNPNGNAGWKGDWSRYSNKWTYDLKQEVGLDKEDSGVFWMSWGDFCKLFAEVCICRLLPEHLEARQGGWLPSVFGCGQAIEVEVYAHTQLELTLHQEAHSNRGEASFATLKDLGVAVLKHPSPMMDYNTGVETAPPPNAVAEKLVAYAERTPYSSVSLDCSLESDGFINRYIIVPLCFGHLPSPEPRKFAVAALSTQVLSLETVTLSPKQLAAATIAATVKNGDKSCLIPQEGPQVRAHTKPYLVSPPLPSLTPPFLFPPFPSLPLPTHSTYSAPNSARC